MSKIDGLEHKNFTTQKGDTIEGVSLYVTDKIPPQRGEGCMGDRIFLSKNKLNDLSFVPAVGMDIEVLYNKYGKVSTIRLIADADSDLDL
jgi:hypothetical protein